MVYLILIFFILAIDWRTKEKVKKWLPLHKEVIVAEGKLSLYHIKNYGVAYGKLRKYPKAVLVFTGAAIIGMFQLLFFKIQPGKKAMRTAAAMLLGGALGNFLDRLKHGCVTDFIEVKKKNTPIFNIADCFIAMGGSILMAILFFDKD